MQIQKSIAIGECQYLLVITDQIDIDHMARTNKVLIEPDIQQSAWTEMKK